MKVPLRFQNTEYDCGTASFINALAYLYDREEIPVELLKKIYELTLDARDSEGTVGRGGTSKEHAELLANCFVGYANENADFDITCKILRGKDVNIDNMKKALGKNGVIIARCWQESEEHYVLITKTSDGLVYIFDPYYLEKDYYDNDADVTMVLHEDFTHNRLVKIERLFDESYKDFSLMEEARRSVILINR